MRSSCVGESSEAAFADLDEALHVVGDAAAGAAEREKTDGSRSGSRTSPEALGLAKGIGDA